jgi:hypothetical protein
MDGKRFVWTVHHHGTMTADLVARYKLPCNATLVRVDSYGTADAEGTLIIGTPDDTDGYVKSHVPGHNASFVTLERGDFDGALNADTAECPHIAKDTVIVATLGHNDSSTHTGFALTFLEG